MKEPCKYTQQVVTFLEGELPEQQSTLFEAHLVECTACADELADLQVAYEALVDSRAPVPGDPFFDTILSGVMDEIAQQDMVTRSTPRFTGVFSRLIGWLRARPFNVLTVASAAAIMVVGVVLVALLKQSPQQEGDEYTDSEMAQYNPDQELEAINDFALNENLVDPLLGIDDETAVELDLMFSEQILTELESDELIDEYDVYLDENVVAADGDGIYSEYSEYLDYGEIDPMGLYELDEDELDAFEDALMEYQKS